MYSVVIAMDAEMFRCHAEQFKYGLVTHTKFIIYRVCIVAISLGTRS